MPDPPEVAGEPASWATSKFYKWWLVFDEEKVKAFFIRNYNPKEKKLGYDSKSLHLGFHHTVVEVEKIHPGRIPEPNTPALEMTTKRLTKDSHSSIVHDDIEHEPAQKVAHRETSAMKKAKESRVLSPKLRRISSQVIPSKLLIPIE